MGRQVEVEDVADRRDIKPACGDIRADQDRDFVFLELVERVHPYRLNHIAVQTGSVDAVLFKRTVNHIDIAFAVTEYQRVGQFFLRADQFAQGIAFDLLCRARRTAGGLQLDQTLGDRISGRGRCGNRDFLGIGQELVCQTADFLRHGGREQKGGAHRRQQADDFFDVGNEAHVEHPVGFIDDQNLDVGHQKVTAFEHVQQTARRGNQNIDAPVQYLELLFHRRPADQERLRELVILAVGFEVIGDLRGQFACRLKDQRARHAGLGPALRQNLDHRQGKGRGLSGPRLGTAQYITSHKDHRNGFFLNGGGFLITGFVNGTEEFVAKTEIGKFHMEAFFLRCCCNPQSSQSVSGISQISLTDCAECMVSAA